MWRPRTWREVNALVVQAIEETPSLDFKKAIPTTKVVPKINEEIAKDIAAMTVSGGVLIYGVDEDKETHFRPRANTRQHGGKRTSCSEQTVVLGC
jgi:hypothetical protein